MCFISRRVSIFALLVFAGIIVALVCPWSPGDRSAVIFTTSVWLSHGACLLSAVQEHFILH